ARRGWGTMEPSSGTRRPRHAPHAACPHRGPDPGPARDSEDRTCPPPSLGFPPPPARSPVGRRTTLLQEIPMLWTLIRRHLRPYLPHVLAVIVLQLATVLATLYLPSLNADIIDNGVAVGDTDYIWRVG